MNSTDVLSVERRGPVVIARLNRPDQRNALSDQLIGDLFELTGELRGDLSARVLVLCGEGKGFSAGLDLKEHGSGPARGELGRTQAVYEFQRRVSGLATALRDIPQPVVAALHGPVAGAGLSMALACDMRVADGTAYFEASFLRLGLSGGDMGSTWFLPRLVGSSNAAMMLLTGRRVDAAAAHQMGLVSELAGDGMYVTVAVSLAMQIAGNSPMGIRQTKELLNLSFAGGSLEAQLRNENTSQTMCALTEDFVEGVSAQMGRRTALYQDR